MNNLNKVYAALPPPIRSLKNPLISPKDIKATDERLEVSCVFNAGVLKRGNITYLMLRVDERPIPKSGYVSTALFKNDKLKILHFPLNSPNLINNDTRLFLINNKMYIKTISHLRLATSYDGINFLIEPKPFLFPSEDHEAYGVQDSRMTEINGVVYITFSATSDHGIATEMISTKDFKSIKKHGIIFPPDNRNICIFPKKINGLYACLHRPMHNMPLAQNSIWFAQSPDLFFWGKHKRIMTTRQDYWDSHHIGGGAPPIFTNKGWLIIFHGASSDDRYCLGLALLDKNDPTKVIARHNMPLLKPEMDYEINGFYKNIIFSDGAFVENNLLKIYYGAADQTICLAEFAFDEIMSSLN